VTWCDARAGDDFDGMLTPSAGERATGLAVLVHGAGVTRDEGGFFTRLAAGLAEAGTACLRFDLRAHGASGGRAVDLTIAGIANDIAAAGDHLASETGCAGAPVHVIAASFSGGAAALHAALRPGRVRRLVLLNPRLDYRERYIDEKPYWRDGYITPEVGRVLEERGFTERNPFELGRGLLNEALLWDSEALVGRIRVPVLMVHGTKDTFVPVEGSRRHVGLFGGGAELLELDGAQHGFAVHDDPQYAHPQSQAWQAQVIDRVRTFFMDGREAG
jgi:pimeloyl-ACP methyl ester carboxylesterase